MSSGDPREIDIAWWRRDGDRLPIGTPFRPELDRLPAWQEAWAVVKDRWGRPARGVPISVFDLHDRDAHVPGSGAVVVVAALGSEVARRGRLRVGELRAVYPGVSDLLSPRAGDDPMHADFKIQGYETPDGTFAQFVRFQAPQLLAHSERLTLAEGASFMLDLETVYKALCDVARVQVGERVFVEGAAGGTGTCAGRLRGARVTGLVSREEKGRLVLARGGHAHVNRKDPALAGVFTAVPPDPAEWDRWREAGRAFTAMVAERNDGAPIDVVVSSVGRDLFPRMVDLLGPGGRIVFYGAASGGVADPVGEEAAAAAVEARAPSSPPRGSSAEASSRPTARAKGFSVRSW